MTKLPSTLIIYATLIGQLNPWNGKMLLASSLIQDYGELNIVFRQTLYLTTHKVNFGHYLAAHLCVVGAHNPFYLPQFFFDVIYSTSTSTLARGSFLYNSLVTRLYHDQRVSLRSGDTFIWVEEPLTAASLTKGYGSLHGSAAKQR